MNDKLLQIYTFILNSNILFILSNNKIQYIDYQLITYIT